MALARDKEGEVPQPREGETAMSRGKTAPAIVQDVVVRLGADLERDERGGRRAWRGLAARDQIRARAADGVLDHVRQEEGQDHAGQPPEQRDVRFVRARAGDCDPGGEDEQGHGAGVDEEPCYVYALVQGVWVGDAQV